jgi:carboxyl-terminal processing protease
MRGAAGSLVKLNIDRNGTNREFELIRMEIKMKNVTYFGMIDAQTGYIKLDHFMEQAGLEVRDALNELKSKGANRVMLDLRDNGGGLLHESVNVCNTFIGQNELVVFTQGRLKEMKTDYKTLDVPADLKIPLVVLVNHRSASASEFVSGTMQDLDRGVLVGRNTYGKGLVQGTKALPYRTQMKITTAKYYIPSGRCIQLLYYSHRNPDGSAASVPDSLRSRFTTRGGRIVKDGGGVRPDVEIPAVKKSHIAEALEKNYIIYDFATQYRDTHDSIAAPKNFELTETDFKDFKAFIISRNYVYDTETDKRFSALKTSSEEESYAADLADALSGMKNAINKAKAKDMDKHKDELLNLLKTEISRRYYYQDAVIESAFTYDPDILEAVSVFNSGRYSSILVK